jgi:hypothetical protein
MNYTPNTPNTIDWPKGSLVIHDADAKAPDMLMVVTGHTRDGRIKTQYIVNSTFSTAKVWTNPKEALHDPASFGIPLPAWYRPPQPAPASASEASPPATATPQAPGPVAAVYAKYKHLDRVIARLPERNASPRTEGYPFYTTLFDLWTAIKAQEAPHA